ncbi:MAG: tetratricopeptide repeat protein [Puia sp.]
MMPWGKKPTPSILISRPWHWAKNRREYYGARAALQIGYIYESQGDKKTALIYFRKVLDMKSHDYKNALDQKAKAGIERCTEG